MEVGGVLACWVLGAGYGGVWGMGRWEGGKTGRLPYLGRMPIQLPLGWVGWVCVSAGWGAEGAIGVGRAWDEGRIRQAGHGGLKWQVCGGCCVECGVWCGIHDEPDRNRYKLSSRSSRDRPRSARDRLEAFVSRLASRQAIAMPVRPQLAFVSRLASRQAIAMPVLSCSAWLSESHLPNKEVT